MADLSLKARISEKPGPTRRYFSWAPAGKPVTVRANLEMVERLAADVMACFRAVTAKGSEIGGVLIGRVEAGSPIVVVVEDYALVPCDYSRGPLYQLAGEDFRRLKDCLESPREGGLRPVGFFRSHTRKGLVLDSDDLAVCDEHFRGESDIFLLVRPFTKEANVGCFFVREGGAMRGGSANDTFPFDAAELQKPAFAGKVSEPPARPPEPRAPAPVIPISDRKPAAERERREAPAPEAASPPKPAMREPESAPVAKPAPREPEPAKAPPEPETRIGAEIAPPSGGKRWLWIGLAAAVILAAAGWFVFRPSQSGPSALPFNGRPELRVERTAGQLLLTWDREASWVRSARSAVLFISDGSQREDVQLDLNQLRTGSIVYMPVTNDVSFRMEVTDGKSGKTEVESVRVLGTRPSPMPPDAPASGQATAAGLPAIPGQPGGPALNPDGTPVVPPTAEAPKFQPPPGSLAARLRSAEHAVLPEPPSISGGLGAVSAPAGLGGAPAAPAPLAPSVRQAPTPPPAAAAPPPAVSRPAESRRVSSSVVPARLVSRRDPIYPQLARQNRISGSVRLELGIGQDGKVKDVKVVSGPPILRQAAVDAVRGWRYEPARLNGQVTESSTIVELNFNITR